MPNKYASNSATNHPPTWKTVVVILTLLLLWPIGLILMIIWMKWPAWAKILVAIATAWVALMIVGFFAGLLIALINPRGLVEKAQIQQCTAQCQSTTDRNTCMTACLEKLRTPSTR